MHPRIFLFDADHVNSNVQALSSIFHMSSRPGKKQFHLKAEKASIKDHRQNVKKVLK